MVRNKPKYPLSIWILKFKNSEIPLKCGLKVSSSTYIHKSTRQQV